MVESKEFPKIGVRVILFDAENNVLSGRRKDHPQKLWSLLGGKLEKFEQFQECAQREVDEETDLGKLPLESFKQLCVLNVVDKSKNFHFVNIMMGAKLKEVKPEVQNRDEKNTDDWKWHNFEEFKSYEDLFPSIILLFSAGFETIDDFEKVLN